MMRTLGLAVAHFPGVLGRADVNLGFVDRLSRAAANDGAEFILFPEDCLTGYPAAPGGALGVALSADGPEIGTLKALARRNGITIAAGFIEGRGQRCNSAHFVARPDGGEVIIRKRSADPRERRIGLVPVEQENADFDISGARAALAICSDGADAFFDAAARRGVRIILHPSGGGCVEKAVHANDPDAETIDAAERRHCQGCVDAARRQATRPPAVYAVANSIGFTGEEGYPGNSFIISAAGEVLVHLKPTAIVERMTEAVGVARVPIQP